MLRRTTVLERVRRAAFLQEAVHLTDGELLECFATQRDEAAFEALVRRHGPMVMGVCRRLLQNPHDAEDAFQATFLVLVRKAAVIVPREKVGSWLYGTACLAAKKTRASVAKRRTRERQVKNMPELASLAEGIWHDLVPLLDQELGRLPDRFRLPIVLCDLEGKTRKEAARQLSWPEGTVAGRLAQGRAMLAKRLRRRGLPLSGGVFAAVLSQNATSAGIPMPLVRSTVKVAALVAAGKAAADSAVSAPVAAITEGVLKAMLLTRIKIVTAVLLMVTIAGGGVGMLTHRAFAAGETPAAVKAGAIRERPREAAGTDTLTVKNLVVEGVDSSQHRISVATRKNQLGLSVYPAPGTTATITGVLANSLTTSSVKVDAPKVTTVTGVLAKSLTSSVKVDAPKATTATITGVLANSSTTTSSVKVDAPKVSTVTSSLPMLAAQTPNETKMDGLPVAKDARILIKDKAGKLADLKKGMRVTLELGVDQGQLVVKGIKAD
jgi:RNA polymerase sigma factor (sigma-70 family)